MKKLVRYLILIAVVFAVGAGFSFYQDWQKKRATAKFEHLAPSAAKYKALVKDSSSGQRGGAGEPDAGTKASGKPVLVCMSTNGRNDHSLNRKAGQIDPLINSLPETLFPTSVDEAGTVVGLYWNGLKIGNYDNDAIAYQETCRVKVVDLKSGTVLAEKEFTGGSPPQTTKSSSKKIWGSGCEREVLDFVEQLF